LVAENRGIPCIVRHNSQPLPVGYSITGSQVAG